MNQRRSELIEAYFHGTLSAAEQRELADALLADAGARQEFARHALWVGGVGRAIAQLRARSGESRPLSLPAKRSWWRMTLAMAALLLLATGIAVVVLVGGDKASGASMAQFEAAFPAVGSTGQPSVQLQEADGSLRQPVAGEIIPAGASLLLGPGAGARVRLDDGSEIDLDEDSEARFGSPATAFSLMRGSAFCSVSKRPAGTTPFVVGLPQDRTATALGTRFELTTDAVSTRLRVEEGHVQLKTPSGVRNAGPLQMLQAAAAGDIPPPTMIALHEIAAWKYRTEQVPAGTTVYEDGFEADTGTWEAVQLPGGPMRFAPFKGQSCLILPLKVDKPSIIYANFPVRHRNYELRFRLHVVADKQVLISTAFNVADAPEATEIPAADAPAQSYHPVADDWIDYRSIIRGSRIHLKWLQNGRLLREATGRIPDNHGHYTRIGLRAAGSTEDSVLMIDRFSVTNLGD